MARSGWRAAEARRLDTAVNVRLPASVVEALDAAAEEIGAGRSDVVRAALFAVATDPDAWPDAAGTAVVREHARALEASARGAAG